MYQVDQWLAPCPPDDLSSGSNPILTNILILGLLVINIIIDKIISIMCNKRSCCKVSATEYRGSSDLNVRLNVQYEFIHVEKNIAKGTTDPGVDYFNQ